jgi:ANTAR domain/GAF domain
VQSFIRGSGDVQQTLSRLADLATTALDADMAGLTFRNENGRPTTIVYTDRMVPEVDEVQYDFDRGPCLDAARTHTMFQIDDMRTDTRWPEFAASASSHGLQSSLSVPVVVAHDGLGALNFYDQSAGWFGDSHRRLGEVFAGQCAIVGLHWSTASEAANLAVAMQSRAVIEQAKGVIMATTGCLADDAFALLREQSQRENRKLRDIASEIVARQKR